MGSSYWWVVGIILFLNYFIQRPALLLVLFSPLIWADVILSGEKLQQLRSSFGDFKFFSLYVLSVLCCLILYLLIRKIASSLKKRRSAIYPNLLLNFALIVLFVFLRKGGHAPVEILFVLSMICIFYSSAFVLIVFDCLNSGKTYKEKIQSFFLLNTFHFSFMTRIGAQLGPSGTAPFFSKVREREQTQYLRKKGVQVALVMVSLKIASDLIGYVFLGVDNPMLQKISLSRFEVWQMGSNLNIPRYFLDHGDAEGGSLHLGFFIRSMNWYLNRISYINFKILLLWMLGFYIKLGVDEPWKSKSFADFFRRTHVYVAHFYRVFVYPIFRPVLGMISNKALSKYIAVWLMIFVGGIIFQTVSHSSQLMYWRLPDIVEMFKVRMLSDALLATCVVTGLFLEKGKRRKSRGELILWFMIYVQLYSFLMTINSTSKLPGFTLNSLFHYFEILTTHF